MYKRSSSPANSLLFCLLFLTSGLSAQVAINQDNSAPDPSAMLDVKSSEKGMLVPRMNTVQREAIASPATGLLVFDETTNGFWFFNGTVWQELSADADADPANELQNLSGVLAQGKDAGGAGITNLGPVSAISYTGDGSGLTNLPPGNCWGLTGNGGTVDGTNFIGTTDNVALDFRVNNARGLRLEYYEDFANQPAPNIIGGYSGNKVSAGVYGATISGGGRSGFENRVTNHSGTIGGGINNISGGLATVSGGVQNTASGIYSTVPGGYLNSAEAAFSFAAGRLAQALHAGTFVWADNTSSPFSSTAAKQFLIRAGNGVGINKNNPATALDVNGTVTATAFAGDGSALTGISDDQTLSLSGNTLSIADGNSVDLSALPGDNLGNHAATQNINLNGNWLSGDGGDKGVFVSSNGFVGIGTSDPQENLHIIANTPTLRIQGLVGNSVIQFFDDVANKAVIGWHASDNLLKLNANGNLSSSLGINIAPGGYVGIGTESPASRLDVNGTVTATAFAGDGSALTGITDDQTLSLSGTTLSIEGGNSIDLASIDTDTQTLNLSGTTLSIEGGNSIDLASIDTDTQTLNLSGTTLSIEDGNSVNLSNLQDNLGNHTATQNLKLNSNYLSGDGDNEGLFVDETGNVGIGTNNPRHFLNVVGSGNALLDSNTVDISELSAVFRNSVGTSGNGVGVGFSNSVTGANVGAAIVHETIGNGTPGHLHFATKGGGPGSGNDISIRMTIQNDGDVGIGTTTPTEKLHVNNGNLKISQTANPAASLELEGHTAFGNQRVWAIATKDHALSLDGLDLAFSREGSEKMRIDTDGNVGIGTNDPDVPLQVEGGASGSGSMDYVAVVKNTLTNPDNGARYNGLKIQAGKLNNNDANSRMIAFHRSDDTEIGSIRQNNSNSVSYNTSSDIRLKQNIAPTGFSINDLMRIEVRDYEFRAAPGQTETGFIAQQLYDVYPGAVSKGGDDVHTDPWMVDYGKLTPLLVKSVQDQQATIEDQQKRIAELEAQVSELEALKAQNTAFEKRFEVLEATLRGIQSAPGQSSTVKSE